VLKLPQRLKAAFPKKAVMAWLKATPLQSRFNLIRYQISEIQPDLSPKA
jgi:hypothetical protein